MLVVNRVVMLSQEEYNKITPEQNILYVTYLNDTVSLYYNNLKVSNVVKVDSLEGLTPDPETFYVVSGDFGVTLYYSYTNDQNSVSQYPFSLPKGLVPVIDSSVSFVSSDSSAGVIFGNETERVNFVGVDPEGNLFPSSISAKILESFGDVDLSPVWSSW